MDFHDQLCSAYKGFITSGSGLIDGWTDGWTDRWMMLFYVLFNRTYQNNGWETIKAV